VHDWSNDMVLKGLSTEKIGNELAERVATQLDCGHVICNMHRDYCGHGLAKLNDKYGIFEVHDGFLLDGYQVVSFLNRNDFIAYLSRQSDYSLSGADSSEKELFTTRSFAINNQRLSRSRLIDFIYESSSPSPKNNAGGE